MHRRVEYHTAREKLGAGGAARLADAGPFVASTPCHDDHAGIEGRGERLFATVVNQRSTLSDHNDILYDLRAIDLRPARNRSRHSKSRN
jgi:hypothetical protein